MESKKAFVVVTLLMVLLASLALITPAFSGPGSTLEVKVVDKDGSAMAGATVKVTHVATGTSVEKTTGIDGKSGTFDITPCENYKVKVSKTCHTTKEFDYHQPKDNTYELKEVTLLSSHYVYIVMGGAVTVCTQLGVFPVSWWSIGFRPLRSSQNITFSDPHPVTGIVNLTVPAATYLGINYTWYDNSTGLWFRLYTSMTADGHGWLFTGTGTSPILGDVDCYTFNNNTGVYWHDPRSIDPHGPPGSSRLAGEKAAGRGLLPDPGPDGVAGTIDDGFGNGTADPPGSSILYLNTTLTVEYATGPTSWTTLFVAPWPQVLTTAIAYDMVTQNASLIKGANSTEVGEPWEFLAGKHGYSAVPHDHPKWNAFVTYALAWSVLNTSTTLGPLDAFFEIEERKVREDCVIADIDGTQEVDITDIVICALAFGAKEQYAGPDGKYYTADDKKTADPNWNTQADINTPIGEIDIGDIVRIAIDFGAKLTPNCIIRL